MIRSSHFTADGASPPLLQNPSPTLKTNTSHFVFPRLRNARKLAKIIAWSGQQNTLSLHDQEPNETTTGLPADGTDSSSESCPISSPRNRLSRDRGRTSTSTGLAPEESSKRRPSLVGRVVCAGSGKALLTGCSSGMWRSLPLFSSWNRSCRAGKALLWDPLSRTHNTCAMLFATICWRSPKWIRWASIPCDLSPHAYEERLLSRPVAFPQFWLSALQKRRPGKK